nr:immunoglobulin heavy chain junction region [Mus musculus]MBK4184821.1 immunoglobulin heavy chain junction region [Mus musculus]
CARGGYGRAGAWFAYW